MTEVEKKESANRFARWRINRSLSETLGRINKPKTTERAVARAHAIVDQFMSWGEIKLKNPLSPYSCPFVDHIEDKVMLLEYFKTAYYIIVDGSLPPEDQNAEDTCELRLFIVFHGQQDNKLEITYSIQPWGEISGVSVSNNAPSLPNAA